VNPAVSVTTVLMCLLLVGSTSSSSLETMFWRRTFWVSTSGDSPTTVIVSSTAPTPRSAFTVAVKPDVSSMASRRSPLNPDSVKVTV
jgi:hypothetical protein